MVLLAVLVDIVRTEVLLDQGRLELRLHLGEVLGDALFVHLAGYHL